MSIKTCFKCRKIQNLITMKIISKNSKAFFDFEILEKHIAGIILAGAEVKSVRANLVNLKGSYVSITKDQEVFIENMHISPYQNTNSEGFNPTHKRKLLLKSKEIEKLSTIYNTAGQTIVPLCIGLEGKYIKVEIAVARGKKLHDKRQSIKKRDLDREMKKINTR